MGEMQGREVLPQLGPQVWWVFLRLDSPRSARELAKLGGVTAATVEGHLRTLKARGLVDRVSNEDAERRFEQTVRLSQDQLDQVGALVAAANLKQGGAFEELPRRESLPQLSPRTWWVFLQLESPRTSRDLARLGGLEVSTVEGHLRKLRREALVEPTAGAPGKQFQRAVRLSPEQREQVRTKVAAAGHGGVVSDSVVRPFPSPTLSKVAVPGGFLDPAVHKMTRGVWKPSEPSRFEVRCVAARCLWKRDQSRGTEAQAVEYFELQWREHVDVVRGLQHLPPSKPTPDREWLAEWFPVILVLGGAAVVALVLWGVVSLFSGGGGSSEDPCDGYRADVVDGSAQDVRDIRNGENPCY